MFALRKLGRIRGRVVCESKNQNWFSTKVLFLVVFL